MMVAFPFSTYTKTLKPEFGLSGSALKVIALISMVIDHVALYLMEHGTVLYETMRCIGRIAFPVFAFLIAEGLFIQEAGTGISLPCWALP